MKTISDRKPLGAALLVFMLVWVMSFFIFPVGFRGLPESLNSKQILGVLGILFFGLKCVNEKAIEVPKYGALAFIIAVIFSVWCYYSCYRNGTDDYSYALYVVSFSVWTLGAYATCKIISAAHGYLDMALLTKYLAAAGVLQCVCALMVDNITGFQNFVDTWFIQDTFPKECGRLYGVGCSLDSGGVRFCFILIMMAHQIGTNPDVTDNKKQLRWYLLAYLILCGVGSMISRTTWVGMFIGIGYILVNIGFIKRGGDISPRQMRFHSVLIVVIVFVTAIAVFFYNHNYEVRQNLRFAFEGFFNYFEKGEFQTDSFDELNSRMWIWPTDSQGWTIGYGVFAWTKCFFQTDIGYCRYTMYCGLVGLVLFSIFFIYNGITVYTRFKNTAFLSLLLIALTFIVWIKVATDIFQLYALLLCLTGDYEGKPQGSPGGSPLTDPNRKSRSPIAAPDPSR